MVHVLDEHGSAFSFWEREEPLKISVTAY